MESNTCRPKPYSKRNKMKEKAAKMRNSRHPRLDPVEEVTQEQQQREFGEGSGQESGINERNLASVSGTSVQNLEGEIREQQDESVDTTDAATDDHPDGEGDGDGDEMDIGFGYEDLLQLFKEWVKTLHRDHFIILTLMIYYIITSFLPPGTLTKAAELAGNYVGVSGKSVMRWRDLFIKSGEITTTRGKYERKHLFDDEDLKSKAIEWIRKNSCKKGVPNMTAADFCRYVNDELLHPDGGEVIPPGFPRQISVETARKWLHDLGFSVKQKKKGIYVDGHDREDVIEYRKQFLDQVKELEDSHMPPPKASDETESEEEMRYREECVQEKKKELVFLYHDESAFNSNDDETKLWADNQIM